MYITVQEARDVIGCKAVRSIYDYIKAGKLRTDPESKKVRVSIEDVYRIREEKRL